MSRKSRRKAKAKRRQQRRWAEETRFGVALFSVIMVNLMFGMLSSMI